MANMGGFSVAGMKKLQKQLNKIQQGNVEAFVDACAKELAARLLAKVIKRTPVGDYSKEIEVVAKKNSKHHKKVIPTKRKSTLRVKKAVRFAGAGLLKPMWKPQAAAEKAKMRKRMLIPLRSTITETLL